MTNPNNPFADVLLQAETDPDIYALIEDIFGKRPQPPKNVAWFSAEATSFSLLVSLAAPVLYRWAIDTMNSRRARLELDAAKQRLEMILSLKEWGLPPEVAEGLVTRCLEAVAKRDKDDPATEKLLSLAGKVGNPALLLTGDGNETDAST